MTFFRAVKLRAFSTASVGDVYYITSLFDLPAGFGCSRAPDRLDKSVANLFACYLFISNATPPLDKSTNSVILNIF